MTGANRSARTAQAPRGRALRIAVLSILALAMIATAGLLGGSVASPASAQTATDPPTMATAQRRDCETVDLLLLMDQSGSLANADPDGRERLASLNGIRHDLSGETGVRVALIGFDAKLTRHAEHFEPAAADGLIYPSDHELEASLQTPSDAITNYGVALRGASDVFRENSTGSCRELVWFTDGVHNTVSPSTEDEVARAEDLLDEVCEVVAPTYADQGVRTQVVLLGNDFERRAQSPNRFDRRMAELSARMISAITGDKTIGGFSVDSGCEIGDLPPGAVLETGQVIDLPNRLIESVAVIRDLRRWSDCVTPSGEMRTSDHLPAGAYIDALEIFAYGGTIDRYRLGDQGWETTGDGARRVTLKHDDLKGLPSGWVLEVQVAADPGTGIADVKLSCFSKPVSEPLKMEGWAIETATEETAPLLEAGGRYDLAVDMGDYDCESGGLELRIETLSDPRLGNAECRDGDARFGFEAVAAGENREITAAVGHLEPMHADTLWSADRQFGLEVELRPRATILSDRPLECSQVEDEPRAEISGTGTNAPRSRIVAGMCIVTPQPGGDTQLVAESSADQPSYHFETPDGERVSQPFEPNDGPQRVRIISDEMPPDKLPANPGTVSISSVFQPSNGRSPTVVGSQQLQIGSSTPSLVCRTSDVAGDPVDDSGIVLPRVESSDGGTANRLVLAECVPSPSDDQTSLTVRHSDGGPLPGEWMFVDQDGRPIPQPMQVAGDETEPFVIVLEGWTEESASANSIAIIQEPTTGGPSTLPVWTEIPLPEASNSRALSCGEASPPEIPPGFPLRVVVNACQVDPPESGSLTVTQHLVVDADLGYSVELSGRGGDEPPWRLDRGADPLVLRVVSDELGDNGWDYEGSATLTVTAIPDSGVAQLHRRTIKFPPDLLNNSLSCEEMVISNADEDEVPTEPLQAGLTCEFALRGSDGELHLTVSTAPDSSNGTGNADPLNDWRFLPASELFNDGRALRFNTGEELSALRLMTAEVLPNDRLERDGKINISAEWTSPAWQEPLTATTTVAYTVDLWPRSILWLALLITVAAALLTWFLLYGVVAASNRLPRSSNFFARRLEFSTYRDARGKLRSRELEGFNPDEHPSVRVDGDSSQKWLQAEDLRIAARHPKWWQVASMLRGGWGQATVRGLGGPVEARPTGPGARAATTREQFSELAVVALESPSGITEPRGVAYVLEPQRPSERSDGRRTLAALLADMTPRSTTATSKPTARRDADPPAGPPPRSTPSPGSSPPPRDVSGPPPRDASKPPPPPSSKPPPRERPK